MSSYDLIRVVGEGATAVSYLAKDKNGREVLVKRFKTAFYNQENDFKREVQVLCGLAHPQIPQYIDSYIEKVDGRSLPHIVQEFIHGRSLEEYLKSHRPSQDEVLDWLEQLLGVLSYLHALRPPVIHRDIKPSNILLRDGQVVLIDFGLAVDAQIRTMGHTMAVGTLGYQAPEQISGRPTIQSDLYSTGALAVELLTGQNPTTMLDGMRLRWQEKCMDLPTSLQQWLDKMLDYALEERFSNAQEAISDLPLLEKKIKVIQSAVRKPTNVNVSDDFMAMLALKKEKRKKEEEAQRRATVEAKECTRKAKEQRERERIRAERAKRDAQRHREEILTSIYNEEALLVAEMEAAWNAGIPDVIGKKLEPEDLIAAMKQGYGARSPIEKEGIIHDVVHPLYLLCTMYERDEVNVATLSYRKWVVDNKSSQWGKDPKIQDLVEQLRKNTLEVVEKDKQLEQLDWFSGLFQKEEREKERHTLLVKKETMEGELKEERKVFVRSCLEVYWKPWFGPVVERWVQQQFQNVQQYIQRYKRDIKLNRQAQQRLKTKREEREQKEREEDERLEQKRELLEQRNLQRLEEHKQAWSRRGKRMPPTFVLRHIPAGSFFMGSLPDDDDASDDEKPQHKVTLTRSLWMSAYPCTQELYEAVMGSNPSSFRGSTRPVEKVSWCDAVLFCNTLSELEGLDPVYGLVQPFENSNDWSKKVTWNDTSNGYRLPTEAEWEYCARGGEAYLYAGSNNLDEVGWYEGNSGRETHPVAQKKPNGFGLYDMSGNVWEWVFDSWKRQYKDAVTDPIYIDPLSSDRFYQGGSWSNNQRSARVSSRFRSNASYRGNYRGFRFLRFV